MKIKGLFIGLSFWATASFAQQLKLARMQYGGGGDWYSSRTALPNLARFCNRQISTGFQGEEAVVQVGSSDLFQYPFVFLTGHGNVVFSESEAANLRLYLESGGFLHICDNYGLDAFVRREMKKVFPELEFRLVPFSHPIYKGPFSFSTGLPKVHEHDGKSPQGWGLFVGDRLVCFYDYQCDLGNGWEDAEVYNDPEAIRIKALQMGANLVAYALGQ
jgi:hypothetical protein